MLLNILMRQQREGEEKQMQGQFSLPALEKYQRGYSLDADIATGWQPKIKVVGPVPLNFDSAVVDEVVDTLITFNKRYHFKVVYLGWRHASSFKMQQDIKRTYTYKFQSLINTNFPHLAAYFRKFYENFKGKTTRAFRGMNPALNKEDQLVIDSNFESGNLDAAIQVGQNEYDCFMRVDTNTRGHIMWYNFTFTSKSKRRVKINLVNFRKHRTLYNGSLKPYLLSSKYKHWKQGGKNVKYSQKMLRYIFLEQQFRTDQITYNCLSFEHEFSPGQTVQFAYCPPFTYSNLLTMITDLHTKAQQSQKLGGDIIKEEVGGQSLGGLQIPLLTVTDPKVPDDSKKCILITGRIHPGQTCGSFMVKGFLQFICSQEQQAQQLRQKIVFKVIPMLNPDGVTVGNYRTSLCGRDLNRMFKAKDEMLIPQVKMVKSLVSSLKKEFKNRLFMFLDFHGHSQKRNVFVYGPQYQIWETNYYRTRILPKIIADRTQIFRYYSCSFRVSQCKRTTARAVLLKQIPFCYTVQASVGSYYLKQQRKEVQFTPSRWEFMGKTVASSIAQYLGIAVEPSKKERQNMTISQMSAVSQTPRKKGSNWAISNSNSAYLPNPVHVITQIEKQMANLLGNQDNQLYSQKMRQMIQEIQAEGQRRPQNDNQSDRYSGKGSDSDSQSQDMPANQINQLHHQIINSMKEFKDKFYNKGKKESVSRPKNFIRSSGQVPSKGIEMIASLRKKAQMLGSMRQEKQRANSSNCSGIIVGKSKAWREFRGQSQSFQVYVNRIQPVEKEKTQNEIGYHSPYKSRNYRRIIH